MAHDYKGFAERELEARLDAHYPPYAKVATVEVGHKDYSFLSKRAEAFAESLAQNKALEVLGPVDAYIPQVRGTYWMHLLVKASSAVDIRKSLLKLPDDLEVRVNIDPQ